MHSYEDYLHDGCRCREPNAHPPCGSCENKLSEEEWIAQLDDRDVLLRKLYMTFRSMTAQNGDAIDPDAKRAFVKEMVDKVAKRPDLDELIAWREKSAATRLPDHRNRAVAASIRVVISRAEKARAAILERQNLERLRTNANYGRF